MSPGISLSLHWWRGFGPDAQGDLFWWRYRLGLMTVSVEGRDPWAIYQKLRATVEQRVAADEQRFGSSLASAHQREQWPTRNRDDEEGR
jgi:hypothetical protein